MGVGIRHDGGRFSQRGLVAKHHGAQAQGRDFQIAFAKIAVVHKGSLLRERMPASLGQTSKSNAHGRLKWPTRMARRFVNMKHLFTS
jgi:hypothetical protein